MAELLALYDAEQRRGVEYFDTRREASYSGLNYEGPIAALVHTTTNAYPRAIFLNAYYLIGRSDRPTKGRI